MEDDESTEWATNELVGWDEPINEFMQARVDEAIVELNSPGVHRHDVARDRIWGLLCLCAGGDIDRDGQPSDGNPGGLAAVTQVVGEFIRLVSQKRDPEDEAKRLVRGGLDDLRDQIEVAKTRHLTGRLFGDAAIDLDDIDAEWIETLNGLDNDDATPDPTNDADTAAQAVAVLGDDELDVPALGEVYGLDPAETTASLPGINPGISDPAQAAPAPAAVDAQRAPATPTESTTPAEPSTPTPAAPAVDSATGTIGGMSEADFWAARPALAHIQQFARSRRLSPWALLGNVLVRVMANVPPEYVVPPIIGADGSLNLYSALLGTSGIGKGTSSSAADDCIDLGDVFEAAVGTGEGIPKLFGYSQPAKGGKLPELIRTRTSAVIAAPEVATIGAIAGRSGATILSELCKGWSGETLGRSNASVETTVVIDAHSYRLGALVGVQPGKAGILLDDADAGTPQRFRWLPARDTDMPDIKPPEPPRLPNPLPPMFRPTGLWAGITPPTPTRVRLKLPAIVAHAIDQAAVARHRGHVGALDGHAMFTRVKVMYALSFLDGRLEPNEQDWQLAGAVMAKSDATRAECEKAIRDAAAAHSISRGKADAVRAITTEDVKYKATLKRVAQRVEASLADGNWHTWSEINKALPGRDRGYCQDAVTNLEIVAKIEVEPNPAGKGKRVRLKPAA
ncbi:hypothetical protein CH263_25675 [Rhodococcus sp. 06-1059B-a]|nr:hypothetical protein [Rhodococcus sp. 06-1059B-a]OZD57583.1 hypothetical protein CH263_25675 [Rhodococcus sp. 06-1059B-a]